ncbi:MAG: DNA primase [Pseudomonadota bacterium]|nr:DNA primase [Pseudomonadota bacterium]
MAIPRHIVDEVRARTDIAELIGRTVTLRRAGRSYSGLCPFHNEKSPSFNVVPDKGIFHCFGCGEGGDAFAFLMKSRGVSFYEAVKELGDAAGVVVEEKELSREERQRLEHRADLYDVTEESARFFTNTLLTAPEGAPGREYLQKRGITVETAQKYRLGFAPDAWDRLTGHLQRKRIPMQMAKGARVVGQREGSDRVYDLFRNRLMFPILDDRGRVVAFGGRLLPGPPTPPGSEAPKADGPKYLNSPESEIYNKSRTLYGLSWARLAAQRKDRVLVVEGYFDAVSLWQGGFEEVMATCGTALTPAHLEVISRLTRKVVALFDSDEAGLKAATKSMELFLDANVEAKRLDLKPAKDPDEFIQQFGAEAFEGRLAAAQPLLDLVFDRTIKKEGSSSEGRARAEAAVIPLLRRLPRNVRDQMLAKAADVLGIRPNELIEKVGRVDTQDARSGPPPSMAPPPRWVPSRELAHLLWLLLHFPAQVAPVLADADPTVLTDRRSVLEAIVALAGGAPLAEVADPGRDADLARALRAIAARPAEYQEEQAQSSARALVARLELARIESEILTINAKIAACETSGDKSSYVSLAKEISTLYARQRLLKTVVATRATRGPASSNP